MKKILYFQITIILLFVLIMFNQKFHFFEDDAQKAIQTGILVGLLISLGRMIKIYKNED